MNNKNIADTVTQSPPAGTAPSPPVSFGALRHPGFRAYFITTALAMMADNIEHVISSSSGASTS